MWFIKAIRNNLVVKGLDNLMRSYIQTLLSLIYQKRKRNVVHTLCPIHYPLFCGLYPAMHMLTPLSLSLSNPFPSFHSQSPWPPPTLYPSHAPKPTTSTSLPLFLLPLGTVNNPFSSADQTTTLFPSLCSVTVTFLKTLLGE